MNLSIRRAQPGDESLLRDLRIQALTDEPYAFGSTLARELARTAGDWQSWIANGVTFLLFADGAPRGMVAGLPEKDDPSIINLMARWVHPGARASGAAGLLVSAVKSWALEVGATEVRLHCVEDNLRAKRFYERVGFRATGKTFIREKDGAVELEMACAVLPLP
jgi:GNAT superfamily N-acetyltransferase